MHAHIHTFKHVKILTYHTETKDIQHPQWEEYSCGSSDVCSILGPALGCHMPSWLLVTTGNMGRLNCLGESLWF